MSKFPMMWHHRRSPMFRGRDVACARCRGDGLHRGGIHSKLRPGPHNYFMADRSPGRRRLPAAALAGPARSRLYKAHPYVPNGRGQPTYRVADITNPILKPWADRADGKANDAVLAGKVPFIARERCWPAGVPGFRSIPAASRCISTRRPTRSCSSTNSTRSPPHLSGRAAFGELEAVVVRRVGRPLRRRRVGRRYHRAQRQGPSWTITVPRIPSSSTWSSASRWSRTARRCRPCTWTIPCVQHAVVGDPALAARHRRPARRSHLRGEQRDVSTAMSRADPQATSRISDRTLEFRTLLFSSQSSPLLDCPHARL